MTGTTATYQVPAGQVLVGDLGYNATTKTIELVAPSGAVDGISASGLTAVVVNGGPGNDQLGITGGAFPVPVTLNGGGGTNTLFGPAGSSTWTLTGADSGTVAGVAFSGFQDLIGAAGYAATFVLQPGGSAGYVDGGGSGTLVVNGGQSFADEATGPHSGTVVVDGVPIGYAGMAPITVSRTPTVTITGTGTDSLSVSQAESTVTVKAGTIESVTFSTTGLSKVTINGNGNNESINFATALTLSGATLDVNVAKITVLNVAITTGTGAIDFTARASDNGSSTLTVFTPAKPKASITLRKATLTAGTITLAASAESAPTTSGHLNVVVVTATATVLVANSTITATGNVTVSSSSHVTATATSSGSTYKGAWTASTTYAKTDTVTKTTAIYTSQAATNTGHTPKSATTGTYWKLASAAKDAAASAVAVTSNASSTLSGTTSFKVTGTFSLTSTNAVTMNAIGDASGSGAGAGVAVGVLVESTTSEITATSSGNKAASLTVKATATNNLKTTAQASVGGATSDTSLSTGKSTVSPDALTNPHSTNPKAPTVPTGNANTSTGPISVAGALGFSYLKDTTVAAIAPTSGTSTAGRFGLTTTASGVGVHANTSNTVATTGDGATNKSAKTGVGVGIAVNVAKDTTKAYLAGTQALTTAAVDVSTGGSTQPSTDTIGASATSGLGDDPSVAFKGSFALNVVTVDQTASISPSASIAVSGATVSLSSTHTTTSDTKAVPKEKVFDPQTAVGTDHNTITLPYKVATLKTGTALVYSNGGGTDIGGLATGGTYYAFTVKTVKTGTTTYPSFKLAAAPKKKTSTTPTTTALYLTTTTTTGNEQSLLPAKKVSGVGVGLGVAVNVVNDTGQATIGTDAALTGAKNLTLKATTEDTMGTEAASGSEGGVAITPVVAVSVSNVRTHADLGTATSGSSPLVLSGALTATGTQSSTVTTSAKGNTTGATAAIGASVAVTVATHTVTAQTHRSVTAHGAAAFSANGSSSTTSVARAGVDGADKTTTSSPNTQGDAQLTQAKSDATTNGVNGPTTTTTPSASTGSGGVSVAAAAAFNLVTSTSDVSLPSGTSIRSTGAVTLASTNNTHASADGDGEAATEGGSAAVGVGVGVNLAKVHNTADLTPGSS
ncbi:MAG: hypothetical protein M0Z46_23195, partial [Actinomycetota bacterium]|nr:hypothetical protein [Actinomycetota bacterium]